MMLKPRQRPKRPPREAMKSTGPILMLLSISRTFSHDCFRHIFPHPSQCPCQRRCWQQQCPHARRCSTHFPEGENEKQSLQGTSKLMAICQSHRWIRGKKIVLVSFPQGARQGWDVGGNFVKCQLISSVDLCFLDWRDTNKRKRDKFLRLYVQLCFVLRLCVSVGHVYASKCYHLNKRRNCQYYLCAVLPYLSKA